MLFFSTYSTSFLALKISKKSSKFSFSGTAITAKSSFSLNLTNTSSGLSFFSAKEKLSGENNKKFPKKINKHKKAVKKPLIFLFIISLL